jgi:hypothetical protein
MQLRLSQLSTVTPTMLNGGAVPVTASTIYTLGNARIHPERSREFEGGADLQLWGDVLSLTLTFYDKLRRDAIQQVPVGPSVLPTDGPVAGSYYTNVGDIRNRGIEASMTARLIDTRAFQWMVNGNVSHNTNILVRAATTSVPKVLSTGMFTQLVQGYPIDGVWARPIVGYFDSNGDGVIESSEVRVGDSLSFVGSSLPNYELSLTTQLSFLNNRMTVNTAVDFQQGMTQFLGGATSGGACGQITNGCLSVLLNNPTISSGEFAAIAASAQTAVGLAQTVNVFRWQSLSVNYLVPTTLSQRIGLANLSLYVQGSNLALHTNYQGKDPNVNANASGNFTNDTGQLPEPRLWSVGVRIGN